MKIDDFLLLATIIAYAITPIAAAWLIHRLVRSHSAFGKVAMVAGVLACMLLGYALSSNT